MSPVIRRRPVAIADLESCLDYLRSRNPQAAIRLVDRLAETLQRLARGPSTSPLFDPEHPRLADVRVASIDGFRNILLFYRPVDGGIELLRVLHGARDLPTLLDESPA